MPDDFIECKCGCGNTVPTLDSRGRKRQYVLGHHRVKSKHPGVEELRRLYVDEKLGVSPICRLTGAAETTVREWLREAEIPTRPAVQTWQHYAKLRKQSPGDDVLKRLYLDEKMTIGAIGKHLGFSGETVRRWLGQAGIRIRSRGERHNEFFSKKPPKEDLERMYLGEEMCASDIAKSIGISVHTAAKWLRSYGIRVRTLSETQIIAARKKPARDESKRPGINPRTRYLVLSRDEFRCRACGRSPKIHGVVLHVDHIHPRSKGGADDMDNFQSLCADCNQGKSDLVVRSIRSERKARRIERDVAKNQLAFS